MGRSPSSRGGGVNKGTGQQGRRGASLQAGRWALCGEGSHGTVLLPQSSVLAGPSHVVGVHVKVCLQDWFRTNP